MYYLITLVFAASVSSSSPQAYWPVYQVQEMPTKAICERIKKEMLDMARERNLPTTKPPFERQISIRCVSKADK